VIDAHAAPLHWDRATVVHPRSLELFESLRFLGPLLAAGVKQRVAPIHSQGGVLGEIDLAICGSRYGFNIGISEEVTESILTEYLHRQGGEVIRATSLVDLADRGDHLLTTIQHEGARKQVTAQWVVGCDGLNSASRTLAGIDMIGHDIIQPWAVFDATLAGWQDSYEANYAYLDRIPVIRRANAGPRKCSRENRPGNSAGSCGAWMWRQHRRGCRHQYGQSYRWQYGCGVRLRRHRSIRRERCSDSRRGPDHCNRHDLLKAGDGQGNGATDIINASNVDPVEAVKELIGGCVEYAFEAVALKRSR
jgi:hypothetical protein